MAIKTSAINNVIQMGDRTQTHDQLMYPVSFNPIKRAVKRCAKDIFIFLLVADCIAEIIAEIIEVEVDKGSNWLSVAVSGVRASNESLSVFMEDEEHFVFHGALNIIEFIF